MRIIVLAAGEGSRLRPYTRDKPKCMVSVFGKPIIEYQLKVFEEFGIDDITVVTGYKSENINYPYINIIKNQKYKKTNMVYSLMCAKDLLNGDDDVIITYGDIIFEKRIFKTIYNATEDFSITIDKDWKKLWSVRMTNPLEDAETLKTRQGKIVEIGKTPQNYEEIEGQYMGIIKIKSTILKELVSYWESMDRSKLYDGRNIDNLFFTSLIQCLIDDGWVINPLIISNGWLEIDSVEDLEIYEKLYASNKLENIYKK